MLLDYGAATNRMVVGNSAANYRYFGYAGGANSTVNDYNGMNGLAATMGSGTWTGGAVRFASSWSAAGRSLASNGGSVATSASPFPSIGSDSPYVGSRDGVSQFLNGWIASMAFYDQRLPDATLQAKSSVGASY